MEVLQLVDWHWPWDHRSMACLFHDIAESLRFRTSADVFAMNGSRKIQRLSSEKSCSQTQPITVFPCGHLEESRGGY